MSGIFNTGIRDYCGEESSITKLSHHFSKDYAFQQDGINFVKNQNVSDPIPTSFALNELLNETLNKSHIKPQDYEQVSNLSGSSNIQTFPIDKNFEDQFYLPIANFKPPSFNISHNIPMNRYIPPDQSLIAKQWAEDELTKFENTLLNEEDLKNLTQEKIEPNVKFLDVVRDIWLSEEKTDIEEFNEKGFLYDLDEDLKDMRDRIDIDANTSDIWKQIEKSIEENSRSTMQNKNSSDFVFKQSNPYLKELQDNQNLGERNSVIDEMLKKGIQLFKKGYFAQSSMIFEAVVQMKPESETGWSHLAISLSENEQDDRAMIACKKCLELNKNNCEILLSLARIHSNEMNLSSTITCLERWLLAHPKYSDLATVGQQAIYAASDDNQLPWDDMYEMAFESSGKFSILDEQLSVALNRNSLDIDPELEIVAGTLYHSVQDYDRATERFEAAVNVVKDNACLWNKLGTSYCNSGNYEKAVDAYRKALELAPGFARAECNLGVAFYNMDSYKEAIVHAIRAYKIQHAEKLDHVSNADVPVQSDPIWTLIRMSSFKLDRTDLDLVIFNRDIDTLSKEFDV